MPDTGVHTLNLAVPPDDVDAVHLLLETVWSTFPQVETRDRFCFETALVELASNVIRHADAGSGVRCTIDVAVTAHEICASLADSGVEFEAGLGPVTMPGELEESGRGLALIQALVTELVYSRDGDVNRWRITRERAR